MAKKDKATTAYGTELVTPDSKCSYPVRSRYMAAALAIVFGVLGVNHFYLRNIIKGILMIVFSAVLLIVGSLFGMKALILIPVVISVLQGIIYLCRSDNAFCKKNHVRTV